jgi:glucose-6-phosphate 1-dehydrogenase
VLIIGGTSDLSRRHLLPALTRLLANDELGDGLGITLTGLEPMSVEACRNLVAGELARHGSDLPSDARRSLTERIFYLQADVRTADALQPINAAEPSLIYVATPPDAVPAAIDAVGHAALHRSARIVLDKPFGLSRSSAQALNAQVLGLLDESQVYRVDHFLYHHSVQWLVRRRLASDNSFVPADVLPRAELEIRWDETRTAPPNGLGVMRDMIQSHLLQLAAVVTMNEPASLARAELARDRLEALRLLTRTDAPEDSETSAVLALRSGMPRWKHVRLVLRAAKGADTSCRQIELRLASELPGFVRLEVLAGTLVIGDALGGALREVSLPADTESASTRLLRAALTGDDTFTLSPDEPEEQWRIIEGSDA